MPSQVKVRSTFHNGSFLEHDNPVGNHHGAEAVRDDDHRSSRIRISGFFRAPARWRSAAFVYPKIRWSSGENLRSRYTPSLEIFGGSLPISGNGTGVYPFGRSPSQVSIRTRSIPAFQDCRSRLPSGSAELPVSQSRTFPVNASKPSQNSVQSVRPLCPAFWISSHCFGARAASKSRRPSERTTKGSSDPHTIRMGIRTRPIRSTDEKCIPPHAAIRSGIHGRRARVASGRLVYGLRNTRPAAGEREAKSLSH